MAIATVASAHSVLQPEAHPTGVVFLSTTLEKMLQDVGIFGRLAVPISFLATFARKGGKVTHPLSGLQLSAGR